MPMKLIENIAQLATCAGDGGQGEIHAIADAAMVWAGRRSGGSARAELPASTGRGAARRAAAGWSCPGWSTATPTSPSAGGAPTSSAGASPGQSYLDIARGGRRYRADGPADARGQRGGALSARSRLRPRDAGSRRHDDRMQERIRARPRERAQAAAGLSPGWPSRSRVRIVPTFLGAHIVPPEYRERREAYVSLLVDEMIPAVAAERLAACCDVFVEESAFTVDEARRILLAGEVPGSRPSSTPISSHPAAAPSSPRRWVPSPPITWSTCRERGIAAMAEAGVVAVSLPIASLYLGQPPMPARRLIGAGVACRGGHRLQPRFRTELSSAVRPDPGVHPPADDAGGGAQGCYVLRRQGFRAGAADRLAGAGQGRRFRPDRRAGRRDLALPSPPQCLPPDGERGPSRLAIGRPECATESLREAAANCSVDAPGRTLSNTRTQVSHSITEAPWHVAGGGWS